MKWYATILVCFLLGCNPAKKLLKDHENFEQIGNEWAKLHPCANDTSITIINGGTDTFFVTPTVMPGELKKIIIDSLRNVFVTKYHQDIDECGRQISDAWNTGFDQATYECSQIKVPVKLPDTVVKNLLDTRSVKAEAALQLKYVTDLATQKDISAKLVTARNTAIIIACALSLLLILLIIILLKKWT